MKYRLNRLRDEMDFHLVTTTASEPAPEKVREFYEEQQVIWAEVSNRWLGFRKLDRAPDHR